jgi:hypothetical protein
MRTCINERTQHERSAASAFAAVNGLEADPAVVTGLALATGSALRSQQDPARPSGIGRQPAPGCQATPAKISLLFGGSPLVALACIGDVAGWVPSKPRLSLA